MALAILCMGLVPLQGMAAGAALSVLHSFNDEVDRDGQHPRARLVEHEGRFYGTTSGGGEDECGTIFSLTPTDESGITFESLHSLASGLGCNLIAGLTVGPDDNLYGVTEATGSITAFGKAFRFSPASGAYEVLYTFDDITGDALIHPIGSLMLADGEFYGTTASGGLNILANPSSTGTVFKMTSQGEVTRLHSFDVGAPGMAPRTALAEGSDGALYGTTTLFGACPSCGTVFRIEKDGSDYEVLHAFDQAGDIPSELVAGPDGKLYGTVGLNLSGQVVIGRLLLAQDGNFYGYNSGIGRFFSITTDGDIEFLHSFSVANAGIFRLTPGGELSVLVSSAELISQGFVGFFLEGGFIQGDDGHLYGASAFGGDNQCNGIGNIQVGCGAVIRVVLDDGGNGDGNGNGNGNENPASGGGGGGGGAFNPVLVALLLAVVGALRRRHGTF